MHRPKMSTFLRVLLHNFGPFVRSLQQKNVHAPPHYNQPLTIMSHYITTQIQLAANEDFTLGSHYCAKKVPSSVALLSHLQS